MRIAMLTNDYPPHARGGCAVIASAYAEGLRARGHEIEVFCDTSVMSCVGASLFFRGLFHLRDLRAKKDLATRIRTWNPDVLITHNVTGCGFGTPRMVGVPWVHVLHDVQLFEPSGAVIMGERWSSVRFVWRRVWAMLRERAMGMPDAWVSPTHWLLDAHRLYGMRPVRSFVIPNPIPLLTHSEVSSPETIVYAGRLEEDKGVDVLIDAWRALSEPRPELHLIGDGRLRGICEQAGAIVHGAQSHETVMKMLATHPLVVLPSRLMENQPTIVLEAIANGCEILASDVGGVRETIGECGTCVPAGDVDALQRAMNEIFQRAQPSEHHVLKQQALRDALLSSHRVDVACAALESVIVNLKIETFPS